MSALEKNTTYTDCASEEGITVGLIDSIITAARVLATRPKKTRAVTEALKDLREDVDVAAIMGDTYKFGGQ